MSTQLHFSSQPLHESPDHNSSYSHQNGIGDRLFLGQRRMILLRVSLIISPLALFGCPNGNIGSALSILLPCCSVYFLIPESVRSSKLSPRYTMLGYVLWEKQDDSRDLLIHVP